MAKEKWMSYLVYQTNKKTGVTYVYEAKSYWDKEKQQARNKQVCIGKLDPKTKKLIPSKRLAAKQDAVPDPRVTASAKVIGPSILLDAISNELGLKKLLKSCFPKDHLPIMSMAYYLVTQGNALSRSETWSKSHAHPATATLTSQRISELLSRITIDHKQTFLKGWMEKVLKKDCLFYDIMSISSYSELNEYVKYGRNKDGEPLPQINLGMLFAQESGLPVYFQKTPGNITDVTTLANILKTFKSMNLKAPNCVLDRGFYSKKNIDDLFHAGAKFTVGVPLNNKWAQKVIDAAEDIHGPEGYQKIDGETLYVYSTPYKWGEGSRRCYVHVYFNAHARAKAIDEFNEKLLLYKAELEKDKLVKKHQEAYETFFVIKTTPKRGRQISYNNEAVSKHIKKYTGFFVLLSNSIKDSITALQVYRDKDKVEKSFNDLKNQLDMKRLRMHSAARVDGRLFVQFIALILTCALRDRIRKSELNGKCTIRELLGEMETLTRVKYSGKYGSIITELTKQQREILQQLKIDAPK